MASVDLNLLTVLDALLQENSVTGAARRLNLTPPGVSRSLARLRRITGDPLLVRQGRRLVPTPTAEALRDSAHRVLADVHDILAPRATRSDAEIERELATTFTIQAASDTAELFGPAMVQVVRARTTDVRLRLLDDGLLHHESLPGGSIDLYLGAPLADGDDIVRERLLADRMVLVGRRDGVLGRTAVGDAVDPADLVSVAHITASRRGDFQSALDTFLEERGLAREVVATTPGYTSAFTMLRNSDFLCLAPEGLTRSLLGDDLIMRKVDASMPPVFIEMAWHRRTHSEPSHRWLRDRVREAALSTCPDELERARHRRELLSTASGAGDGERVAAGGGR